MKGDGLARYYDRLSGAERARLALAAEARGDEAEVRRLVEMCPSRTYTLRDAAYTDLIEASQHVALGFALLWLDTARAATQTQLGVLGYQLAEHAFEAGWSIGLSAARGVPRERHPVWQAIDQYADRLELRRGELEAAHREALACLKGVAEGLIRFCARVELTPEWLLGVWAPPILAQLEAARAQWTEDLPVDSATAEQTYRMLCTTWPGLASEAEGGPAPEAHAHGGADRADAEIKIPLSRPELIFIGLGLQNGRSPYG